MLGFGQVKGGLILEPTIKVPIMKVKDFTLKKSEMKSENYDFYLYLYSGEKNQNNQILVEKPSPEVLKTNPVIFIETKIIDDEIVFIYKKINSNQMKKLNEGTLIGSLVYFE